MQELLQTGAFKVKAVARDVSKPAAQRLQERGAKVVGIVGAQFPKQRGAGGVAAPLAVVSEMHH